jgi:hypothetical protein
MLGDTVWPDRVAGRAVPEAAQNQATEVRERLLRTLEGGARATAPEDAAAAQVAFDCWLEVLVLFSEPDRFSD